MAELEKQICKECNEEKFKFEFPHDKARSGYVKSVCKECSKVKYAPKDFPPRHKDYYYPPYTH